MQTANLVTKENWCHHPACRGKHKFANHLWDVCPNNRSIPHYRQQAANKEYVKLDSNKRFRQKSRYVKTSKPDTKHSQRFKEEGSKRKREVTNVPKEDTTTMLTGWNSNKRGNRASPAVRHTIKTLHQLPSAEKKRILSRKKGKERKTKS
jgi:hypothetical protein